MLHLPQAFQDLIQVFAPAFTRPSFDRFKSLVVAGLLTVRSHTVSNLLRTLEAFQKGHATSFHRFFSKRRWKPWRLAHLLCSLILNLLPEDQPIFLAGDDTVDGHPGRHVYGKGRHRDAVRSSHTHLVFRWGHKWVVLSVLVKLPWAHRAWALPCLIALCRPKPLSKKIHKQHKTPPELMQGLLAQMIHWFPSKKFIFSGDRSFGTQQLACFASRHSQQLTLVSRLPSVARLFEQAQPKPPGQRGRTPLKGKKLPRPKETVSHIALGARQKLTVRWYGGGNRRVRTISKIACWHRGWGHRRKTQPLMLRWVHVEDLTGTHREEYFFSTDPKMTPTQIIDAYVGRWSLETTFQELRPHLGLETTRGWSEKTVLRAAPALFGLYSLTVLLFAKLPGSRSSKSVVQWKGKSTITFSDAITHVRRWLWVKGVFASPGFSGALAKLTPKQRKTLLYGLAPAA